MDQLNQAITYATMKHSKQFRKGTSIPYIVHPIEVMQILRDNGATQLEQIAGVLHDTIEDTDATYDEIKLLFGDEVADMVAIESEHKGLPYKERKYEHMMRVSKSSKSAKMVNCADKLSNLRSIYIDLKTNGEGTWNKFNASKEDIMWYYGLSIKVFEELSNTKMYKELVIYYDKVFNVKKYEPSKLSYEQYYEKMYTNEDKLIDLSKREFQKY